MKSSFMFCLALLPSIFCGCSTLTPYKSPPREASLFERQEIYAEHAVTFSWWSGVKVGGRVPGGYDFDYYREFGNYYDESGDTFSASSVRKFVPWNWVGLGSYLGGAACYLAALEGAVGGWSSAAVNVLGGSGIFGICSSLVIFEWGPPGPLRLSAKSFDEYLKRDLGISENSPMVAPTGLSATSEVDYSGGYLIKNRFSVGPYLILMGFRLSEQQGLTPSATIELYDVETDSNKHIPCDLVEEKDSKLRLRVMDLWGSGRFVDLTGHFSRASAARISFDPQANKDFDFEGDMNYGLSTGTTKTMRNRQFLRVE